VNTETSETTSPPAPRRVEFSMSPLYAMELLTLVDILCDKDNTIIPAKRRLLCAIRASGYTEETLDAAARLQLRQIFKESMRHDNDKPVVTDAELDSVMSKWADEIDEEVREDEEYEREDRAGEEWKDA
jgi:hypothetical protein